MESQPRKTRSDAKLEQLSPAQRERLHVWLEEENRSYAEVVARLRDEFNLTVGKSAVALYWRRHLLPSRHAEESEIAAAIAALPSGAFDVATLNQARALAWTALTRQVPQVQEAATLLQLLHRADRLAIARQRVALEERRLALREAEAGHEPRARAPKGEPPVPITPAHDQAAPATTHDQSPTTNSPIPTLSSAPSAASCKNSGIEPDPTPPPNFDVGYSAPAPTPEDPGRGKEDTGPEESKSDLLATHHPLLATSSPPPPSFPGYSELFPQSLSLSKGALVPPPAGAEPEALSKPCQHGASYRAPQRDITHGQPPTAPEAGEQAAPQVAVPSAPTRHQTAEPRLRLRSLGEGGPRPRPPALTQAPWA